MKICWSNPQSMISFLYFEDYNKITLIYLILLFKYKYKRNKYPKTKKLKFLNTKIETEAISSHTNLVTAFKVYRKLSTKLSLLPRPNLIVIFEMPGTFVHLEESYGKFITAVISYNHLQVSVDYN